MKQHVEDGPAPTADGSAAHGELVRERDTNSHTDRRINLLRNDNIIVTDTADIYYAEAQEKVTKVYTKNGEFTMPVSISDFHSRLPQDTFFRCHRSYVVNLSQIREIVPWFNNTYLLRLRDLEAEVPVSRGKVKEFRQLMRI